MKLKDISYETDFIWEGQRYTQVVRPKKPIGKFMIACRLTRGQGDWVNMPSGRDVKPVIKLAI